MKSFELTEAVRLLKEVMGWHADKHNLDYNRCDFKPCTWCEQAENLLVIVNESKNDEQRRNL